MRHARTREPQPDIQRTHVDRIGERADEGDVGVTEPRIRLHGEGASGIAERQDAAGTCLRRDRRLLVSTLGIPCEVIDLLLLGLVLAILLVGIALRHRLRTGAGGLVRLRAGILLLLRHDLVERNALAQRRHVDAHDDLVHRIGKIDVALVERDGVEFHLPLGRTRAFGHLERPRVVAVLHAFQRDVRLAQADFGNDDAVGEQRERREAEVDGLKPCEFLRLGPVGIGDSDVQRGEVRPGNEADESTFAGFARPVRGKVAINGERPADRFGNLLVDGGLQPVPVEEGDEQHDRHDEQDKYPNDPRQYFPATPHRAASILKSRPEVT